MDRANHDEVLKPKGFQFDEDIGRWGCSRWIEDLPIVSVETGVGFDELG